MSASNQIEITKQIYQRHKNNAGTLNYLYFRTVVPKRMIIWISYSNKEDLTAENLQYANKLFVQDNFDLFEYKTNANIAAVDANVYKSDLVIAECDLDNNITTTTKKYNNLMASDYGSIDLWAVQTTEVSNDTNRYRNQVPVWQKSMNIRNYDHENQGYHTSATRASLNTNLSGYGNAFTNLIEKKESLYKSNNS